MAGPALAREDLELDLLLTAVNRQFGYDFRVDGQRRAPLDDSLRLYRRTR